jgi:hypothetical protein
MEYNKDNIADMLREGVYEVTFTKVNGELRTMPCTLKADIVPTTSVKELREERTRRVNPDNLSVWCTDKNEWRSFKVANVTEVKQIG